MHIKFCEAMARVPSNQSPTSSLVPHPQFRFPLSWWAEFWDVPPNSHTLLYLPRRISSTQRWAGCEYTGIVIPSIRSHYEEGNGETLQWLRSVIEGSVTANWRQRERFRVWEIFLLALKRYATRLEEGYLELGPESAPRRTASKNRHNMPVTKRQILCDSKYMK